VACNQSPDLTPKSNCRHARGGGEDAVFVNGKVPTVDADFAIRRPEGTEYERGDRQWGNATIAFL
jgi:hypothetical protein